MSGNRARRARAALAPCTTAFLWLAAACDRNPFDATQQPRVTVVQSAATVVVQWQPSGAQLVRVYRGATAGDGYGESLMWSIAASSRNSIMSGVPYGTVPAGGSADVAAKPLVPGETYTAQVTRQDPRGTGDGFTNTSNRYVGTATFTAPGTPVAHR